MSAPTSTSTIPVVGADLRELVGTRVLDWVGEAWSDAGYRIERAIGMGGMAVAFMARSEEDGPERHGRPAPGARCVLKVLLPVVVIREAKVAQLSFKKEVIALSRLAEKIPPSPFVVRYLDAGVLPAWWTEPRGGEPRVIHLPWCAVELVDGRPLGTTLDERLRNASGPLEPQRAAALIEGIVRGVRAVHAAGLVHRDLKPSNVLVCGEPPNELPKITDFGVARAAGMGDTFDVTVGTSGYAALEQLEGPRTGKTADHVGPWSDVFSLGAIIYEILARGGMYDAPSAMQYVGKVLARNFQRLAARNDLGDAWLTPEGRALCARWDELLLRATSPRSPGGGNFASDTMPLRHRDLEELLDDLEPLLESTRALGGRTARAVVAPSVVRVHENVVSWRRWEWTVGGAAPEQLSAAAIRPDGMALGATSSALYFWNGERWGAIASRGQPRAEDEPVGVLQGGAGTFVVVRRGGEVEVLPGGGGAFSFRLPFAVKRATALAGHPLGMAWIAAHAAHGDWVVLRMQGRVATQVARLGASARIDAIVRAPAGDEELIVVGGSTLDRRGPEAMVASIDRSGRVAALPPIPGPAVHALALDADSNVVVAGPAGAGRIDLARASLAVDDMASISPATAIDALVALADGQVWGFSRGVAMRRGTDRMWRRAHAEPALESVPVLAAAASGARVWSVHQDGRVLSGRLSIGDG